MRWLDHYHLAQGGKLVAYLRSAFVSSPPITIVNIFTNHHRYQLATSEAYPFPLQRLQRAAGARKHRVEASICPSINGCQEDKDKQLTRLKKAKYSQRKHKGHQSEVLIQRSLTSDKKQRFNLGKARAAKATSEQCTAGRSRG